MNAHQRPASFKPTSSRVVSPAIKRELETRNKQLDRLSSVLVEYDNDCSDRSYPIAAIAADRAAFWRTTDGQNQVGSVLTDIANTGGDIVAFCKDRQIGRPAGFILNHGLDVLIPLNRKAVAKLAAAYEAFGTFRSEGELTARRVRKMEAA